MDLSALLFLYFFVSFHSVSCSVSKLKDDNYDTTVMKLHLDPMWRECLQDPDGSLTMIDTVSETQFIL